MKRANRRSKQTSPQNITPDVYVTADVTVHDKQQQIGNPVADLEAENQALKREVEELRGKLGNSSQKRDGDYMNKLNVLEDKVMELKNKLYGQSQRSVQRPKTDEAVKRMQDEVQMLKAHKVQLLCKMKLESVQFRLLKASLDKEILQLKKEGRRHEYELQKLSSLNEVQKKVLQRKTQEAYAATNRLKEILGLRKRGAKNQNSQKIKSIEHELEVTERVAEVCAEYEKQMEELTEEIARLNKEAEVLREENFSCLIQNKEADCRANDSELCDLKEQMTELCSMVSQLELRKPMLIQREQEQGGLGQTSVSGSNTDISDMDSTKSRQPEGGAAAVRKNSSGVCCSCSKKSLCKTMKCECRANGGGCGISCGCAPSKCANRGAVPLLVDDPIQTKMAKNVENGSSVDELPTNVVLASQGAMLLQDALVQKTNEVSDINGARRKPLSDVGNKLIELHASKPKQRKKGKNIAIRLVSAEPLSEADASGSQEGTQDSKVPVEIPLERTRVTRSSVSNSTF